MASDLKQIVRIARAHGLEVEISRGKAHYVFRKDGRMVAVAAGSASDTRSLRNTVRDLRAAGVPIPHRGGHPPKRGNQP